VLSKCIAFELLRLYRELFSNYILNNFIFFYNIKLYTISNQLLQSPGIMTLTQVVTLMYKHTILSGLLPAKGKPAKTLAKSSLS